MTQHSMKKDDNNKKENNNNNNDLNVDDQNVGEDFQNVEKDLLDPNQNVEDFQQDLIEPHIFENQEPHNLENQIILDRDDQELEDLAAEVNKTINGSQCTMVRHIDDLKISHQDLNVVADMIQLLEGEFGKEARYFPPRDMLADFLTKRVQESVFTKFLGHHYECCSLPQAWSGSKECVGKYVNPKCVSPSRYHD